LDEEGEFGKPWGLLKGGYGRRGEGADFDVCGGGGEGFEVREERGEILGLGGVVEEGGECAFGATHFGDA